MYAFSYFVLSNTHWTISTDSMIFILFSSIGLFIGLILV